MPYTLNTGVKKTLSENLEKTLEGFLLQEKQGNRPKSESAFTQTLLWGITNLKNLPTYLQDMICASKAAQGLAGRNNLALVPKTVRSFVLEDFTTSPAVENPLVDDPDPPKKPKRGLRSTTTARNPTTYNLDSGEPIYIYEEDALTNQPVDQIYPTPVYAWEERRARWEIAQAPSPLPSPPDEEAPRSQRLNARSMANAMAQADRAREENQRILDMISQGTLTGPSPRTVAQANEVMSRTNTFTSDAPTEEEYRRVTDLLGRGPTVVARDQERYEEAARDQYRGLYESLTRDNTDSAEGNDGRMDRAMEQLYAAQLRGLGIDTEVLNAVMSAGTYAPSGTQTGRMTSGRTLTPTGDLNPNMEMPETLARSLQAHTDLFPRALARLVVVHSRPYAEALIQELRRELREEEEDPPF